MRFFEVAVYGLQIFPEGEESGVCILSLQIIYACGVELCWEYMYGYGALTAVTGFDGQYIKLLNIIVCDGYTAHGNAAAMYINVAAGMLRVGTESIGRVRIVDAEREMEFAFGIKMIDGV